MIISGLWPLGSCASPAAFVFFIEEISCLSFSCRRLWPRRPFREGYRGSPGLGTLYGVARPLPRL